MKNINKRNKVFKKICLLIFSISILIKVSSSFSFKNKSTLRTRSQSSISSRISSPKYETKIKPGNNIRTEIPFENFPEVNSSIEELFTASHKEKPIYSGDFEMGSVPPIQNNIKESNTNSISATNNVLAMHKTELGIPHYREGIPVFSNQNYNNRKLLNHNDYSEDTILNFKDQMTSNEKTQSITQQIFTPSNMKAQLVNPSDNKITNTGWLKISSPKFANPLTFPEMTVDCGKTVKLTIDCHYFLINQENNDSELESLVKSEKKYYFYFRLTKLNLYFTISRNERHILGTILIMSINSIDLNLKYSDEEFCFRLNDMDLKNWVLCANNEKEKLDWVCRLFELLGKISTSCVKESDNKVDIIIEEPTIVVPYPTRFCNDKWNYLKHGADWECECSEGALQSPIDLPHPGKTIPTMIRPVFRYEKVKIIATETDEETSMVMGEKIKLRFKDNLIRLMHNKMGTVITQDKLSYQAQEIQFHLASEHTIMGKRYDMEMQIIHNGEGDGIGKQLILSFLFTSSPGVKNLFFEDLNYFNLPNEVIHQKDLIHEIFIPKVFYSEINENKFYPFKEFSFYTYEGSLTSPPCAESTVLYVAAHPIPLSSLTINLFREAMDHNFMIQARGEEDFIHRESQFKHSYRKAQGNNSREIFYYDCKEFCIEEKTHEKSSEGHYEKLTVKAYEYLYVDSKTPSGLPDSYVVPQTEVPNYDI